MSWRDEIDIVLPEWIAALGGGQGGQRWQRVGTAQPTAEPGVYVVDIRASDLTADQADILRLAGPDDRGVRAGFPVMETAIDGELMRLRVAEFASRGAAVSSWRLQGNGRVKCELAEGQLQLSERRRVRRGRGASGG